jgi:TonB-dependent SusC/RagA subfamily outer membrane receptor
MSSPARLARATLALGVLLAFLHGCAHTKETNGSEAADASEPADASERSPRDPSTVTAEDIRRQPGEPIEEILEGRIAGVEVKRTPDGIAVRIRGSTSLRGDSDPLYVIDGIPIQPGPGGALVGISPYDIESIKVLKGPVDTAMYGVRGANGVIVITTKRP